MTAAQDFYFQAFEGRPPPAALPVAPLREFVWQVMVTAALTLGLWYIVWRWTASLNYDALYFSIPMAIAETGAFVGLALFTYNLWAVRDPPRRPAPALWSECEPEGEARPLRVDVFFATYSEDPELVRLSLRSGRALTYPHPIEVRLHCLDDGRRDAMRAVAEEEAVNYVTRADNLGYKAGNLRNAMELTDGDLIVICDADTRLSPGFLANTLGYFRDPDVAWVQTPQWFFDIPEGESLARVARRRLGRLAGTLAGGLERLTGPIQVGHDPFENDPRFFYDVIQRRRNRAYASFCCGAGSIHRREAVMRVALRAFSDEVEGRIAPYVAEVDDPENRAALAEAMRGELVLETELTPYKFHVSEDIYTSILLHSDPERRWKSVMHPDVESRMLSPQDLRTWMVQRFKYAGGTLDIARHDNPVLRRGMPLPHRLFYASTLWSYLGGIWNVMFLSAPIFYLFTGIPPVAAYSLDFFLHFIPFLLAYELAFLVGTWGVANFKSKAHYVAFFPVNLAALWQVARGERIHFPVTPKERQGGRHLRLVRWQSIFAGASLLAVAFGLGSAALDPGATDFKGLIVNVFWALYNVVLLSSIILAAFWTPPAEAEVPA